MSIVAVFRAMHYG